MRLAIENLAAWLLQVSVVGWLSWQNRWPAFNGQKLAGVGGSSTLSRDAILPPLCRAPGIVHGPEDAKEDA